MKSSSRPTYFVKVVQTNGNEADFTEVSSVELDEGFLFVQKASGMLVAMNATHVMQYFVQDEVSKDG